MDLQGACLGFMILEEDIAEDDENSIIEWYLDLFLYYEKRGVKMKIYVACFK